MDKIVFNIKINNHLAIDGIDFSDSIFIMPIINDDDIVAREFDGDALMVLSEWEKSTNGSGNYLLFTSLIGVADEGGWKLCAVVHNKNIISIKIPYQDQSLDFNFEKSKFIESVMDTAQRVKHLLLQNDALHVEPINIVFPE